MSRTVSVGWKLAFLLSAAGAAFGQAPEKLSLADLIDKCEPSCVRVDVQAGRGRGIGSGFVAREGDWVVTNYHVVAGAQKGEVSFSDKEKAEIEGFLAYDKRLDIAVLKIKVAKKRTPLVVSTNKPRKGEAAIAIGAPIGLSFTATEGIISAIRTGEELKQFGSDADGTWLQSSVPISPGSSGGPLLSDTGEVIGANTASITSAQNVNFATSAENISQMLDKAAKAKVQDLSKIEPLPEEVAVVPRPRPIPGNPNAPSVPFGDTLTIKLPAERRFSHKYRLGKETDEFEKVTWLRSEWIPMKHNDSRLTSAAFRIAIPYGEAGPNLNVVWEMATTNKGFAFTKQEERKFQMLVGDTKIELPPPLHKADLNPQGGGWLEKMTTVIRIDKFLDMAMAKKDAKGRLGPMDFVLGAEELECFRELLSKVPSGKATDGSSTITVEHLGLEDDPTVPTQLARAAKAAKEAKAAKTKEKPEVKPEANTETKEEVKSDEYRTWVSADGKFTVEAKLVRIEPDVVRIQRKDDGRLLSVPRETLSKFDQEYLAKIKPKE